MISERVVEQAALGWFEALGYESCNGAEISPGGSVPLRTSYETAVLDDVLLAALRRTNSHLPEDTLEQVIRLVTRPPEPSLAQNNRWFHQLITNGVAVEYLMPEGDTRGDMARLIDFDDLNNNELLVVHQLTVTQGNISRRADLVIYVNGLPLGVIELKDPSNERASLTQAYLQLQEYKRRIPALFTYNEVMAISDGDSTRVGSLNSRALIGLHLGVLLMTARYQAYRASNHSFTGCSYRTVLSTIFVSALLSRRTTELARLSRGQRAIISSGLCLRAETL